MIRKLITTLIIISVTSGLLFAGAELKNFSASERNDSIILEWLSGTETDLKEYQVERSVNAVDFFKIASVSAKGSDETYRYVDETVFGKITGRTYTYRLRMVDKDGSFSFSSMVTITPQVSGARETWGSIKAIFR